MTTTIERGWASPSYGVRVDIGVIVMRVTAAVPQVAAFRFGLVRLAADRLDALAALLPSPSPVLPVGI
jgi:hypothetical protein